MWAILKENALKTTEFDGETLYFKFNSDDRGILNNNDMIITDFKNWQLDEFWWNLNQSYNLHQTSQCFFPLKTIDEYCPCDLNAPKSFYPVLNTEEVPPKMNYEEDEKFYEFEIIMNEKNQSPSYYEDESDLVWAIEDAASDFTINNYMLRKDVILKKIVRAWKKYYSKEFKKYIGKSRQTFTKIKMNKEKLHKYVKEFILLKFRGDSSKEMEIFFFLFIDKINKTYNNGIYKELKKEFFSMLYSFNIKKMIKLLLRKEYAKMMLNFLNIRNLSKKMTRLNSSEEIITITEFYIQMVRNICIKSLNATL